MSDQLKRRDFIKRASAGIILAGAGPFIKPFAVLSKRHKPKSNGQDVALVKGPDRKGNMYDALKLIEKNIRNSIGEKQVVIKPNFTRVEKNDWLASTQVDSVRAFLEFLKPFYNKKVIIAEGTGSGVSIDVPVKNYEYESLKKDYNVEFYDLRNDTYSVVNFVDSKIHPMPLAVSDLMMNPDIYLVSAAVMKTHGLAVVTLGLKNILMAAPMNLGKGKSNRGRLHEDWGKNSKDPKYFNYNMFLMAQKCFPDLTLIDGFIGMQGNGPLFGFPIDVGVAIASTDTIAADRVGTDVMGHNFEDVAHLVYCADAKMGEGDITRINVLGNTIAECKKNFKPADDFQYALQWK